MISKEDRLLFDRMNKRMGEFTKRGLHNEIVDIVHHELENIYLNEQENEGTDLSRTNFHKFSMNSNMSQETIDELRGLAKSLEKAKSSKISYYRDNPTIATNATATYETIKSKPYGVTDFQSFIDFIDDRDNAIESKIITNNLSSTQWANIYGYGRDKGLDVDTINQIIKDNVDEYTNGSTLLLLINDKIDEYYDTNMSNKGGVRQ